MNSSTVLFICHSRDALMRLGETLLEWFVVCHEKAFLVGSTLYNVVFDSTLACFDAMQQN